MRGADSQHPRRCIGDSGASLVEFALLAPLLFAILLGTITGGLALSKKNSVTNAVREGARLGATLEIDAQWGSNVKQRVVELAAGDISDGEICAEVREVGGATALGSWPTSGCPVSITGEPTDAGAASGTCLVKVWAVTEAELNTLFFTRTLDLKAKAVGLYERPCP